MADLLKVVGARVSQTPWILLAIFATGITWAKSAFSIDWQSVQTWGLPVASSLPRAIEYFSTSFALPVLARSLGISTSVGWVVLSLILTLVCVALSYLAVATRFRGDPRKRAAGLLLVGCLPLTTVLATAIGRGEFAILLGATLVAAGTTRRSWIAGALLFVVTNPEQALFATASLLMVSLSGSFSPLRRRAWWSFGVAFVGFAATQIWLLASGVVSSRAAVNLMLLESSLVAQVSQWPWLLYSVAGVLWIAIVPMIGWTIGKNTRLQYVALAAGLFGMPLLATFITYDGARVLAAVTAPVVLACLFEWIDSPEWVVHDDSLRLTGALVFGGLLAPPVVNAWRETATWLMAPVVELISETLQPLRDWAQDRYPGGNL